MFVFGFVIVMIAIALFAARGFIIANRAPTPPSSITPKQPVQPVPRPVTAPALPDLTRSDEDIVSYLSAEIPVILNEVLASVPLATVEEAMMGCYGTMGGQNSEVRPFQTNSLDDLLSRTMTAVTCMEKEQPVAKFTVSTYKKSKTNPHVDLFAH